MKFEMVRWATTSVVTEATEVMAETEVMDETVAGTATGAEVGARWGVGAEG